MDDRKFINGLRIKIHCEVNLYTLETLNEVFYKALEIGKYIHFSYQKRFAFQAGEFLQSRSISFSRPNGST